MHSSITILLSSIVLASAQFSYEPGTFDGMVSNGRGGLGHLLKHRQNHDISYYAPYHENPFGVLNAPYHYGFATYSSPYHPVAATPAYSPYQNYQQVAYSPYQFASPYHPYQVLATPYHFAAAAAPAAVASTTASTSSATATATPATVDTVRQQAVAFHPSMFSSAYGFSNHLVSGH